MNIVNVKRMWGLFTNKTCFSNHKSNELNQKTRKLNCVSYLKKTLIVTNSTPYKHDEPDSEERKAKDTAIDFIQKKEQNTEG